MPSQPRAVELQTVSIYSRPARVFHWLTVLLLVLQSAVGWLMPDVDKFKQPQGLIDLHLSIGFCIIVVVVLRLLWRGTNPPPPRGRHIAPILGLAASITHGLLYLLLIAVPLMGWANAVARGWSISLFGLVPLPAVFAKDSPFVHAFGELHVPGVWALIAVISLHVLAALYHHFVVKDDTLQRILPRRR